MTEVVATDWTQHWLALNAFLVVFLPIVLSSLKKAAPMLDGPAAFWVALLIPACAGLLGWLTTGDPTLIAAGVGSGFATQGTYQLARRTGLSEGSKERASKRAYRSI